MSFFSLQRLLLGGRGAGMLLPGGRGGRNAPPGGPGGSQCSCLRNGGDAPPNTDEVRAGGNESGDMIGMQGTALTSGVSRRQRTGETDVGDPLTMHGSGVMTEWTEVSTGEPFGMHGGSKRGDMIGMQGTALTSGVSRRDIDEPLVTHGRTRPRTPSTGAGSE